MLSNNSNEPQASPVPDLKAGTAASVPPLNPGSPIEVASTGTGTTTDPVGKDTQPPPYTDLGSLA